MTISGKALVELYRQVLDDQRAKGEGVFGWKNSDAFLRYTEPDFERVFGKMKDQPTADYQQGFYDGVSKVREMVVAANYSETEPFLRPLRDDILARIDALLHPTSAV